MLKYIYIIVSFIYSTYTISQSTQAEWTDDLQVTGYQRILGEHEGNVYLQRSLRGHFEYRKYTSELSKHDRTGKLTHIIGVENLEEQDFQELYAINTDIGIAVIYLTTDPQDKKHFLIAAQIYDHETLSPKAIVDLMKIRYRRPFRPEIRDYISENSVIDIEFDYDEKKSKLAIVYTEEKIGKDRYTMIQYGVYDLKNGFSEVNVGELETEKRSDKYSLMDLAVSARGDMGMLMKEYVIDNELEFENHRPSYSYALYYEGADSTSFIYDLPQQKYFVDDMLLALADDGTAYTAGMIRKKPGRNVYGTTTSKISNTGHLLFTNRNLYSDKEIKKIRGKEKANIQEEYDILDLKISNNVLYGIYQYATLLQRQSRSTVGTPSYNNSYYNSRYDRNYYSYEEYDHKENILVHGFDTETGDRKWTTVNKRKQSDYDPQEYFTYGNMWMDGEGLTMLYNERLSNLKRLKEGKKLHNAEFPEDKTVIVKYHIGLDGSHSSSLLSDEGYYYLPNEGSYIKDGILHMIKVKRNIKRFSIGVVAW